MNRPFLHMGVDYCSPIEVRRDVTKAKFLSSFAVLVEFVVICENEQFAARKISEESILLGGSKLTFGELQMLLCQIEACLNSRPLLVDDRLTWKSTKWFQSKTTDCLHPDRHSVVSSKLIWSTDECVRVFSVSTAIGVLKRNVIKTSRLPIDDPQDDDCTEKEKEGNPIQSAYIHIHDTIKCSQFILFICTGQEIQLEKFSGHRI